MSVRKNTIELSTTLPNRENFGLAEKLVVSQEMIQKRILELAREMVEAYKPLNISATNPLVLVCILKGSYLFTADLARALTDLGLHVLVEFLCVSSYCGGSSSCGEIRLLLDVRKSVKGRHICFVEDIVDSALTLTYLYRMFKSRQPASIQTVVLLDKPSGRKIPFKADYVAFTIPPCFVIGYGLDWDELYRELRDVVVLDRRFYEKPQKTSQNNDNWHMNTRSKL